MEILYGCNYIKGGNILIMKQLVENSFWILVIILGTSYLLFIEFKNYKDGAQGLSEN